MNATQRYFGTAEHRSVPQSELYTDNDIQGQGR